jgi:hypothetical protein
MAALGSSGSTSPVSPLAMAVGEPMWKTIIDAVDMIGASGGRQFSRSDLIVACIELDSSHHEMAYGAMFQTMVKEAPTAPASPLGKVFHRSSRGVYEYAPNLQTAPPRSDTATAKGSTSASISRLSTRRKLVKLQLERLATDFDLYVETFDNSVPFQRFGQWEYHRDTIRRRRELGSVVTAIHDPKFLHLLYKTLKAWGIGRRGSRLIDEPRFGHALQQHQILLEELEVLNIEDTSLDVQSVGEILSDLSANLGIVNNISKIVPGSKTLHHLLPDLVPPLDRQWSGLFFHWQPSDPQYAHDKIFGEAFESFASIAQRTNPSRLIDDRWNTSATKTLDNALIGYCKVEIPTSLSPAPVSLVRRASPTNHVSGNTSGIQRRWRWLLPWRRWKAQRVRGESNSL